MPPATVAYPPKTVETITVNPVANIALAPAAASVAFAPTPTPARSTVMRTATPLLNGASGVTNESQFSGLVCGRRADATITCHYRLGRLTGHNGAAAS